MKKTILINGLIILVVVALAVGATWAWFSAQNTTEYATVSTAKLGIDEVHSFPLEFTNMLPGQTIAKDFWLVNEGNVKEDFYFQMIPDASETGFNFCYDTSKNPMEPWDPAVLYIWVVDDDNIWWVNGANLCKLYPIDSDAFIAKIADDVPAGATKHFVLYIKLHESADNKFQDKSNSDFINFIAVQYDGPAPQSGHGLPFQVWPEGDPNY